MLEQLKTIGSHISEFRKRRKLSVRQLSIDSKVSMLSISKIESGFMDSKLSTIIKILETLEKLPDSTIIINEISDGS